MVARSERLAITGAAWLTGMGRDINGAWSRLLRGESALAERACPFPLRNTLAAVVARPAATADPLDRLVEIAVECVTAAAADAGLHAGDPRVQLVLGTSFGAELDSERSGAGLHVWGDLVAAQLGAVRPPFSVSTACSSGADAIGLAAELIRSGAAEICICGGADVMTTSKRLGHSLLGTMSPSLLRSFDRRHDGTLLGEGAAFLVLEAAPRAEPARYGFLRGIGRANDATSLSSPDLAARGARDALTRCLGDASLDPGDVGIVNAHGSGTPLNDAIERDAFAAVFSSARRPVISATKGAFGHTLGATGAIEAVALMLSLRDRLAPPIFGLEQPDPHLEFPLPLGEPRAVTSRFGLSLTLGFGGFDTCLALEASR